MTALTPCIHGPLAAQSRDDPDPYSLPARIIAVTPSDLYLMAASKTDNSSFDGKWRVFGPAWKKSKFTQNQIFNEKAYFWHEFIHKTNIGKCTTRHYTIIPTTWAVTLRDTINVCQTFNFKKTHGEIKRCSNRTWIGLIRWKLQNLLALNIEISRLPFYVQLEFIFTF